MGGRIECFLFARPEAGRGIPAIGFGSAAAFSSDVCVRMSDWRVEVKGKIRKHNGCQAINK